MHSFRKAFTPNKSSFEISHQDKLAFIGSCFSNHIGLKLEEKKFSVLCNLYGVLFNPISIFTALNEIIEVKKYTSKDLENRKELFCSFQHLSSFSDLEESIVIQNDPSYTASSKI